MLHEHTKGQPGVVCQPGGERSVQYDAFVTFIIQNITHLTQLFMIFLCVWLFLFFFLLIKL